MKLTIIPYADILHKDSIELLTKALFEHGIVGINQIPQFEEKSQAYVQAARAFSALNDAVKLQYAPNRDAGETEGYELGAEKFLDAQGNWQIDNKKASYYAYIADHPKNKWPTEMDLKSSYLDLGQFMFNIGKEVLQAISVNESIGISHDKLSGYGRLLHYHQDSSDKLTNDNWCGEHFDHSLFTALMPAYYFQDNNEIAEPDEAGLYIIPTGKSDFVKVSGYDHSTLLFQLGEFGQLVSNDRVKATKHLVKKSKTNIERFAFAVFYDADENMIIHSHSELTNDPRYADNKSADGSISFGKWCQASFERYRAK